MVRLFILLAVLALAVVIYALIECIRSRPHEVRSISKPGWILTIILVPLIGALMWFMWGRPRAGSRQPQQAPRPAAPDDDIAFLRTLDAQRRAKQREEEQKKREQEPKKRDPEPKKREDRPHGNDDKPATHDGRQLSEDDPDNGPR
ncbi:PLDc_N domain-containing protein [Arthrobacter sp. CAU 1506]|uniref:PLD nuclease N-terminal domain-containing protein n=1 Tax=Arthrobacter sp. CAU 1506 TaxID=2560052 RepID=UPI0010ACCC26|nr:PLD nuclease N-terminal domain-containing protein [Arthrobacter sp. CAU 1506]TJY69882.1 PLDc_N domain-containing protein [Arthrobacter sp. CAU 1506]